MDHLSWSCALFTRHEYHAYQRGSASNDVAATTRMHKAFAESHASASHAQSVQASSAKLDHCAFGDSRQLMHLLCCSYTGGHRAGVRIRCHQAVGPPGGVHQQPAPGQPAVRGRQGLRGGPLRGSAHHLCPHSQLGPPRLHSRPPPSIPARCGSCPQGQLPPHLEGGQPRSFWNFLPPHPSFPPPHTHTHNRLMGCCCFELPVKRSAVRVPDHSPMPSPDPQANA